MEHKPYAINGDRLILKFHPGQWRAWDAMRRFVFVTAGTQGGKTSFGGHWLHREIYHPKIGRGGGDYLAASANYDLFKLRMLPAIRELFEDATRSGRYWLGDRVMELRDPSQKTAKNPKGGTFWASKSTDPMWGRIILRSAESPAGFESSTVKAAWLDECGMSSYGTEIWQAVNRRLSIHQGRVLGTTTLYSKFGWLRSLYDEWAAGRPDVAFIQFDSKANPAFPTEEYDRAAQEMPEHILNMMYRGIYSNPPGMIYDCFDSRRHVVAPFAVPASWPVYEGLDFGGANTAAVKLCRDPQTGKYYVVDEYLRGGLTTLEHAAHLDQWRAKMRWGGSPSEGQWRREFGAAGHGVSAPPVADVEVGIGRVYALLKRDMLAIFENCQGVIGQFGSYSRKPGRDGLPTEEILNKSDYHYLDALRYVAGGVESAIPDLDGLGQVEDFRSRWQ